MVWHLLHILSNENVNVIKLQAKHIRIGSNISAIFCVIEDGFQASTFVEGIIANGSNGVGDGNASQVATAPEDPIANGSNGVGDGNACQVATAGEGPIANGSHSTASLCSFIFTIL